MANRKIKSYWLVLLAALVAANMVLSVGQTQAHYVNTAVWNTVVEADGSAIASNCLAGVSDAPLTILLGEMTEEKQSVSFTLASSKDTAGNLTWNVDNGDYLNATMHIGGNAVTNGGTVELTSGNTETVTLKLALTEKALTTVHEAMDVHVTVNWGDSLQGTFWLTLPAMAEEDLPTEPTETSEPTPTDASEPAPTDASEPAPTDASEPAPTDASEPAPTDASEPAPTDASEPAPTDGGEAVVDVPEEEPVAEETEPTPAPATEEPNTDNGTNPDSEDAQTESLNALHSEDTDGAEEIVEPVSDNPTTETGTPDTGDTATGETGTGDTGTGDTGTGETGTGETGTGDAGTGETGTGETGTGDTGTGETGTGDTGTGDTGTGETGTGDTGTGDTGTGDTGTGNTGTGDTGTGDTGTGDTGTDPPATDPPATDPPATDPPASEPTGDDDTHEIRMETIGIFAPDQQIPVSITLTEGITRMRIGMGVVTDTATEIQPFPAFTCYSLDNGASYYLLYHANTIEIETKGNTQMPILLDFSRVTLAENADVVLAAEAYAGKTAAANGNATVKTGIGDLYEMNSRFLTRDSALQIVLTESWRECTFDYSVEILSADAETGYIPADASAWSSFAANEDGSVLTFQIGEKLPPAGTYRVVMNWSYQGICFAQTQTSFFINYSVYSDFERTGGTEQ